MRFAAFRAVKGHLLHGKICPFGNTLNVNELCKGVSTTLIFVPTTSFFDTKPLRMVTFQHYASSLWQIIY